MKKLLLLLIVPFLSFGQSWEQTEYLICGLSISIDNNDKCSFKIRKSSILDGRIKTRKNNKKLQEGDFICYISNVKNQIIDSIYIGNPLNPTYEYNSNVETLNYHSINSKEGDIILKFNYSRNMQYLSIYRYENQQRVHQVSKIKLL